MASYHAPQDWNHSIDWLAARCTGGCRGGWRQLPLGVLFAGGQRVVAAWIRARVSAPGLSRTATTSCRASAGGGGTSAGGCCARAAEGAEGPRAGAAGDRRLPTKRYGPKVQGAGIHHDPTPGPTGKRSATDTCG
ncbi:MAG: hypothetical protein R3B90_02530 [Planctomycetaceae bacterium]